MKSTITKEELNQFTGTTQYFRHSSKVVFTDGVQYVAEKVGAYWLIDLVASYQPLNEPFQSWELKQNDNKVYAVCEDGNYNEILRQYIPYTDFPVDLMPFKMFFIDGVLLLTSEY